MINRTKALAILFLATGVTAASAQADFKLERTLKLEPGGAFTLETDIGDVTLTGNASSGARVLVTSDEDLKRDFDFAFNTKTRAESRSPSSAAGCGGCSVDGSATTTRASPFRCRRAPTSVSTRPADRSGRRG